MKRLFCLLTALMLCMCLFATTYAEGSFVPSITYKPNPEIVPVQDENGEEAIGLIRDENGDVLDGVGHGCLMVTPIAYVWDVEKEVPKDVERLLTFVYEELNNDNMQIPYEKFEVEGMDAENMVIRDLFDARWVCDEHRQMIEKEGNTFEIKFDLGIGADVPIYVMTYDEEAKEWSPIVKTVNNGDGTVTCTFEHLCAISFSMPVAGAPAPVETPSINIWPWIIILALAVIAIIIVVVVKNKKNKAAV